MEWACYVCYGVITSHELFVGCDYCSWVKHRKCSDWSLEDYYRMNRSGGTHIYRTCESCEYDFGEEAREINRKTFEEKRNAATMNTTPVTTSSNSEVVTSCLNSAQSFYLDPRLGRHSLADDPIDPEILRKMEEEEERPIEYIVVENGTKRGGKLLKGSDGHSYTLKKVTSRTTSWRCRDRDTNFWPFGLSYCGATVIQRGDTFKRGMHEHKHFGRTSFDKKTSKNDDSFDLDSSIEFDVPRSKGAFTEKSRAAMPAFGAIMTTDCPSEMETRTADSSAEIEVDSVDTATKPMIKAIHYESRALPDVRDMAFVDSAMEIEDTTHAPVASVRTYTEGPVEFTIVENGSKTGGRKLVSSDGFGYTLKRTQLKSNKWTCSVRSKSMTCRATVSQKGSTFVRGPMQHCHDSDPGIVIKTIVHAEVIAKARSGSSMPASHIVQSVLDQHKGKTSFITPNIISNLIRTVSRARQGLKKQQTS